MTSPGLVCVATYRRTVCASAERVWENVYDWEHLPWLHSGSFSGIERIDSGRWGWRARVSAGGVGSILIELLTEPDRERYVTRTVKGAGAGSEIWTRVSPVSDRETAIVVEFHVPDAPGLDRDALGRGYTALYARLWDEDESMMRLRQARLDESGENPGAAVLELGQEDALRSRLPLTVSVGGQHVRVVDLDGELIVHSAVCPHWLGPLEETPDADGSVACPWHGYRFDIRAGRSCDGRNLKLATPPRLEIDASRDVRLVAV